MTTNNIISIDELRKQFNQKMSLEEWQHFASVQNTLLEKLNNEIQNLKTKNAHLEKLLVQSSNLVSPLPPEEIICIQQISYLEEQSMKRQLTLEEVKRLDLLVKNLKLIREESTVVINKPSDQLKEADLVAIATSNTNSNT